MAGGLVRCLIPIAVIVISSRPASADEPVTPLIVAHRGLLRHAPENTLANFRACIQLRLGFEFDVQRTRDGHLICIHDLTVDRTTDGYGRVAELTLEQIRRLDAGARFDARFRGEKVPTVEEVLNLIADSNPKHILIAVDLKADNVGPDVVRLAERLKVLDRLLFIGTTISDVKVREQLKSTNAQARTAALANNADELLTALNADFSDCVYVRFVPSREQVNSVRVLGKSIFIAGTTVSGNAPENWSRAMDAGVSAVLTDFPLELADQLREKTAGH